MNLRKHYNHQQVVMIYLRNNLSNMFCAGTSDNYTGINNEDFEVSLRVLPFLANKRESYEKKGKDKLTNCIKHLQRAPDTHPLHPIDKQ